jgi:superfamily II DNA or RNA helicase
VSSKHPDAQRLVSQGLFANLSDFSQFEQRLRGLDNTKEIGDAFEILVEAFLQTQPLMQAVNVWLVGQVPLRIRRQLNLPSDAKGIDGVFVTRAGGLVPYQVKYRTDRDVLPYTEVSSFLGITERSCKDRVIFTNARGLSKDVENRDGLRSVRANHFNALTPDDFAAISAWLHEKPVPHGRRDPRPYQQEAIEKIVAALEAEPRATAVMACGTGKTLVALWVAERLEPRTVLVLVPSLALLSQTLPEWCRESKWGDTLEYLCVCSDPTVSKGVDAYAIRPQDADFPITTDATEVRRFLDRKARGVRVVFSTYQSAPVVAEGMKGLKPFDFGIFDEAHKTTGPQAGLFAFALSDQNLPITRRLFLTATPHHYDIRKRDKEGDFRVVSMDDESVYGPVSYRLSFASAAKQGIICPYKIVISVTTEAEVDAALLKHGVVLVKREKIQAQWVATQLALKRAIQNTKASKVITFHSRVALAEEFASDRSSGVSQYLKDFEVFHVNGGQSAADRESLLSDFKTSEKGVITNARCLTEGVDVPAVDMVAFIDPRRSKVDIAQATGRAMRQSKATGKTTGYIVVPLFMEQHKGETEEEALKRSGFDDVALVIAAMQEQDDDLIDIIRELRQDMGEGKPFQPRRLAEKLEILGPSISLQRLSTAIRVVVIERLGVNWDEMYGRLIKYAENHGDCLVPDRYTTKDGVRLGLWVQNVRHRRSQVSLMRQRRLEDLPGWVWDPNTYLWEQGFRHLEAYGSTKGDCLVPASYRTDDGNRLGVWVGAQRQNRDKLSLERRHRLEALPGWTWDPHADAWEEGFQHLKEYSEIKGHCLVPAKYRTEDGYRLGQWVGVQRLTSADLLPERRQRLEALPGWTWDPLADAWEEGYRHLKEYSEITGDCRAPQSYRAADGYGLGHWVLHRRNSRDKLSGERRQRLEALAGWPWEPHAEAWERGFQELTQFSEREGHCRVPSNYVTRSGCPLGTWVRNQRRNRAAMPAERKRRLEALPGWTWNPHADAWEEGFRHLKEYSEIKGDCRVPDGCRAPDGFRLGGWVSIQRQHRDKLSLEQCQQLEALPGWTWDARAAAWEEGFQRLKDYSESKGDCLVPGTYRTRDGYRLGVWVETQRQNKNKMPQERRERLEGLKEWVWDALAYLWEEGFQHLKEYSEIKGDCLVPAKYRTDDGYRLGGWVSIQRLALSTLSQDRRQRLEALPRWTWDPHGDAWERGFSYLQQFCDAEGHCRVPASYRNADGYLLGSWVSHQRFARTKMPAERRERLEALLGWVWRASET